MGIIVDSLLWVIEGCISSAVHKGVLLEESRVSGHRAAQDFWMDGLSNERLFVFRAYKIKAMYPKVLFLFKGVGSRDLGHLGQALCPGYPQGSAPWGGAIRSPSSSPGGLSSPSCWLPGQCKPRC